MEFQLHIYEVIQHCCGFFTPFADKNSFEGLSRNNCSASNYFLLSRVLAVRQRFYASPGTPSQEWTMHQVHLMKMDVPHKFRCTRDEEKTLLQSQTQERYILFAVPRSHRQGDCNSSAADDTVQATSCPAAFITFINAFSSTEYCSVVESTAPFPSYTEQAVNMFPHTQLLLRATQKSENCLLITLFVKSSSPHLSAYSDPSQMSCRARKNVAGK